ncbi:unnamed protein product [Lathyrus sativus]|nr:unnamed protein product [Lathyrus sativus]
MFEKNLQSGEGSCVQSTQQSDKNVYMGVVGGNNKKKCIFRLGSQAATIKESLKSTSYISTDVSSDKIVAMEAKIEALTVEIEKKSLEQELIKQKMGHWERMFGSFMPNTNQNSLLQQEEGEGDNENVEMSDDEL